jgi:hypothetical protein
VPQKPSPPDESQRKRAQELRQKIAELKAGKPVVGEPKRRKSLKEEIAERAAKIKQGRPNE